MPEASVSTTRTGPRRPGRNFRFGTAAATRTSNGACHEGSVPPRLRRQCHLPQDCSGGTSQQPLVRTIQRPAEYVAGSEQAIDAVVVGDDPAGKPCVDAVAQGADVPEMVADRGEIAVMPRLRGGEHRAGLVVVRR